MSCPFGHEDGAYVLGALSPAERAEFERHLAGCAECSRGVQELAGLPGLLARVDPELLDDPPPDQPVPDTLLPALVREVRRTQRRRMLAVAGVAAAATLAVVAGSLAVTGALDDDEPPVTAAPPSAAATSPAGRAMTPVGQHTTAGEVALTQVLWGTRLDLTCSYEAAEPYSGQSRRTYAMLVSTRDGRWEQVATWKGLPGKTMRLAAATATDRGDIASVEVRTAGGRTVLRLDG